MININGIDLEFNLFDYETAERYESALKELQSDSASTTGIADTIKHQCSIIHVFFDHFFGLGTAGRVFGDRLDIMACTQALGKVIDDAKRQTGEYNDLLSRYVPNRAARRAAK